METQADVTCELLLQHPAISFYLTQSGLNLPEYFLPTDITSYMSSANTRSKTANKIKKKTPQ